MMPLYVKLFNVALDSGNIPTAWTIGVIRPIYKKERIVLLILTTIK
jgi:hypothetical protein